MLERAELALLAESPGLLFEAITELENELFMAHLYHKLFVFVASTLNGMEAVT